MKSLIRRKKVLFTSISVVVMLLASAIYSIETATGDDVDSLELRSIVVEGWENAKWVAKVVPGEPQGIIESKLVDGQPKNLLQDKGNKKSFAIRYEFVYSGVENKVVLVPPADKVVKRPLDVLDENNERRYESVPGIELPGKVKAVSVWILGRGNEYILEGWIEDWKGDTHIYKFGSLDFVGWRPLTVIIPDSVPQDVSSYPQTKTLVFKKFVIRSTHKTSNESVILFFDSLKVLTDVYDVYFDGADMDFDQKDRDQKDKMIDYEKRLKEDAIGNGGS
ncbi:MAG: flagellar filament outer layer protein FlaA [Leptospirales bacterium]